MEIGQAFVGKKPKKTQDEELRTRKKLTRHLLETDLDKADGVGLC